MPLQDALEFDPARVQITGQADTRPPPPDYTATAGYAFAIVALVVALAAAPKWWPRARLHIIRSTKPITRFARKRPEALICAGLTVLAADHLLMSHLHHSSALYALHRIGVISFASAATSIAGLYFWISAQSKI